jgi:hypothetical protein
MDFLNSCVLIMFIACSHMFPMILAQVPHVFPKAVPNRTSNYLISFAQNSSFLTYISKPKERHSILTLTLLFWVASKVFFL